MPRRKNIDQNCILDAAQRVIAHCGAQALTLDMVAAEASISKGGLTYTYPTKDVLLSAMLGRDIGRLRDKLSEFSGDDPATYPELRSLLGICSNGSATVEAKTGAILAAIIHAPQLAKPAKDYFRWMLDRFPPGGVRAREARLAFFAAQGLILLQYLGLLPMTANARKELVADIVALLSAA